MKGRKWLGMGAALALCVGPGCTIAPKRFRDLFHPAPLTRARAVGLGENLPESVAVPALVDRLNDPDPVVRISAHEELKRRTGQDFGYVAWADPAERSGAVERWRAWWRSRASGPARWRRS